MKWLNKVKETSGIPYEPRTPHQDLYPFMTTVDDPESSKAILFNVPGIGDFWCVADEAARQEIESEGLPCLLPDDLAFIKSGSTKEDRFNRLCKIVARRHPVTEEVMNSFNGKIKSIKVKGEPQ
jgi:hypothetical protein